MLQILDVVRISWGLFREKKNSKENFKHTFFMNAVPTHPHFEHLIEWENGFCSIKIESRALNWHNALLTGFVNLNTKILIMHLRF